MKKLARNKLSLIAETLRDLAPDRLGLVVGAAAQANSGRPIYVTLSPTVSCPSNQCNN